MKNKTNMNSVWKILGIFIIVVVVYLIFEFLMFKYLLSASEMISIVFSLLNMILTGFAAGIGFYIAKRVFEN